MMGKQFCHKCGVPLVQGARFCGDCGQEVIAASQTPDKSVASVIPSPKSENIPPRVSIPQSAPIQTLRDKLTTRLPQWAVGVVVIYVVLLLAISLLPPILVAGEIQQHNPEREGYAWVGYILLWMGLLTGHLSDDGSTSMSLFYLFYPALMLTLGAVLIYLPAGSDWRKPHVQRSLIGPLAVSALLAALLICGATFSIMEFSHEDSGKVVDDFDHLWRIILLSLILPWVFWLGLFWMMKSDQSLDQNTLIQRIWFGLIGGSCVELLIAIPMHMIVRRRTECCAGMYTGFAIGVGLIVMLLLIGPAVLLLAYRRYQVAYRPHIEKRRVRNAT